MANLFNSINLRRPKRNMIPLSFENKLTTSFGKLTPCLVEEAIPGDVYRIRTEVFTRFQSLMAPIMDRANISLHYFFVPSRILFKDFYPFLTGEDDQAVIPWATLEEIADATNFVNNGSLLCSLMDYLNLPTHDGFKGVQIPVNLLPFVAYLRIWFEYYRDENLTDPALLASIEGLLAACNNGGHITGNALRTLCTLWHRAYKKDYFTSALPWAQKGDDVLLPLSDIPVETQGTTAITGSGAISGVFTNSNTTQTYDVAGVGTADMVAKTSEIAPTINDLRRSFRIQELLERNARGGTRPQEFIMAHFGVNAKDARLQRPEYIGGSTTPMQISEVLSQNGQQGSYNSALGALGGHGVGVGAAGTKKYRVTEHGYIMCILSVMPAATYFQGLPRMFSHLDKYDFFFPSLANIGEQEIKNKELYVTTDNQNDDSFGYTPRYAEYKTHNNEVHGDFRQSLLYWHMARKFSSRPALNSDFITVTNDSASDINRIFTYVGDDADQILVQLYHHNKAVRLMPYFGNPKF